jgi:hypothetical protein
LDEAIKMHSENRTYIENKTETGGRWGRITATRGGVKKRFLFTLAV